MLQFITIALNAFMELVRQPVFLLLMTSSAFPLKSFWPRPFILPLATGSKLVKNSVLAVMLLAGLFGAVLSASASLAREIRSGTALAVLSKPVGRAKFLLAKYAGLVLALTVLTYVNLIAALLAGRMAFDAYGDADLVAVGIFAAALAVAYLLGGFSNFFLRLPFVSDATFALVAMVTIAFVVIVTFDKGVQSRAPGTQMTGVDWRLIPASLLVLFALWILAALALACSTRLEMIPTLAVCSALFLLGLMSQYFFSEQAHAGSWWASVLYAVTPNWQLFWLADALDTGKKLFYWGYVGKALGYAVCYTGAVLAVGVMLFEDRELS